MKKISLFVALTGLLFVSCSKDDDDTKCESCNLQGEKAEICDNEDGTYTVSRLDNALIVTQEELDLADLTPKEYIELVCVLGTE
ncbi:hypothetical protein [Flagellimonas sp. 2504JD1-5]